MRVEAQNRGQMGSRYVNIYIYIPKQPQEPGCFLLTFEGLHGFCWAKDDHMMMGHHTHTHDGLLVERQIIQSQDMQESSPNRGK